MKVLYVEDNPGDVRLLQYELSERAPTIEIDWVAQLTERRRNGSRPWYRTPPPMI